MEPRPDFDGHDGWAPVLVEAHKRIHDERTNSTADDTSTASRNAKHLSDHSDTLDLFIKQGADGEIIFIKFCCEKCSCKNLTWPLDPDDAADEAEQHCQHHT